MPLTSLSWPHRRPSWFAFAFAFASANCCFVQGVFVVRADENHGSAAAVASGHPDVTAWKPLFAADLSDAVDAQGVWRRDVDGVLTATEDECLWTKAEFENFELDVEFRTADGTNSGIVVYCTDMRDWIPNSVEIQITDDFNEKWANSPKSWQCGAIFGHLAASESRVRRPGEWNRMTVTCRGPDLSVVLNGAVVTKMDMRQWTSAKTNPDGSEIPSWLSTPFAELARKGRIGLQGKHAGAPIFFRNLTINRLSESAEETPLAFTMKSIDGNDVDLNDYRGKVVLIVNVASKCGLTPQYAQLQQLHEKFSGQGLAILGFPCNQFGRQEPGTAEEIATFCKQNYGVKFSMFSKVEVNGQAACELYKFLTQQDVPPAGSGDVSWNFEKFLIDRTGKLIARFTPQTRPDDAEVLQALTRELAR